MDKFYSRYWQDKHIKFNPFDHIPKWTEENFKKHINFFDEAVEGTVLDFGCGEGYFLNKIKDSCKEVYGMDISKLAITKAMVLHPHLNLGLSEHSYTFKDGFFDTIFCLDVLEHILDIETTLEEFNRLLKFGGYLCIATSQLTRLKLLMIIMSGIDYYFYPASPHIRYFTKWNLEDILRRKGFEVIKYKANGKYFGIIPKGQMVMARKI